MENRTEKYVENLAGLVRKETVSVFERRPSPEKFREFHELLKETFPDISGACEWEDFEGSLLLKWKGRENKKLPVMFMNHHDVVEAPGKWEHEPFSADVAEGRLWGRGTLDTKGGLWAMLQAADELAAEGFVPERDVYFGSSCTEETTGRGARMIAEALEKRNIRFEMIFDEGGMILHEPIDGVKGTFGMVGMGEKGNCIIRFIARSAGGHASTPGKNTPLVRLGAFMAEVDRKCPFKSEISPVIKEMLKRFAPYMGAAGLVTGHAGALEGLLKAVMPGLSPAAGAMLKTTLAFTMAQASEGRNVLPQTAWVVGDMRFSHHQGEKASLMALKPIADKYGIEIKIIEHGINSGLADYNSEGFRLIERAVKAVYPEVDAAVPYVMTGASDSRFFGRICKNCFRFVPFKIDEQQLNSIHGLNENINIDTLVPAVDYYKYMMREV